MTAQLSRERLEKISYSSSTLITADEAKAMARMLLAGMDSEPVAVQCPFPCGWNNLNKHAIKDAAFAARGLVADELVTEEHRQAVLANNDRLLKIIAACRAAMLKAGPATEDAIMTAQLSRERIEQYLQSAEGQKISSFDSGKLIAVEPDYVISLCRLALAGMGTAVAGLDAATAIRACMEEFPEHVHDIVEECAQIAENTISTRHAAPPAPVAVPDEMYWQDAPVEGSTRAAAYATGWNDCRAAMLKAEPVTGWIKCSELMPEKGGLYLCYVQDDYEFDISHFCFEYLAAHKKFDSAGINITHWMPLPAAPEQEV